MNPFYTTVADGTGDAYWIQPLDGNRFNVVRDQPTVVAKGLRWEEALRLADELNTENGIEEHS